MLGKILLIVGIVLGVVIVVVVVLGWWVYRKMTGPMYVPGGLANAHVDAPPQDDDEATWLVARDIRLSHFSIGAGRPVLFVHGGPGIPVREPMAWLGDLEDRAVHFYDQRGCGDSSRPCDRFESQNYFANLKQLEGTLGLGDQIADVERIRRLLGEERLLLIGHSFGGFLATLYAAEFPDRVEKLVLLAPADMLVMPAEHDGLFGLVRDRLPAGRRDEFNQFLDGYLDFGSIFKHDERSLSRSNLELGHWILEGMGMPPEPLPGPDEANICGGWMVFATYFSMGKRHDYTDALQRVTTPTLVVHGDRDLQPSSVGEQYARLIPEAELMTVADADHFFSGDHTELARRVSEFLK